MASLQNTVRQLSKRYLQRFVRAPNSFARKGFRKLGAWKLLAPMLRCTTADETVLATIQRSIHRKPHWVVAALLAVMVGCVLGLVGWKALAARKAALVQARENLNNLAHSLALHAIGIVKASDVAMGGMVNLLKYQNPLPERFNAYLAVMTSSMPQLREVGVLNAEGNWRYSSLEQLPQHNSSDHPYFAHHRDNASPDLFISGPLISRFTGRPSIILSKRISAASGGFAGVLIAAIDCEYLDNFYSSLAVGRQGGISLLTSNGTVLARWPKVEVGRNIADTSLFQTRLRESSAGSYQTISSFDGLTKYIAYEQTPQYPLAVTVARSIYEILADWRADLISEVLVATLLMTIVIGMGMLLSSQFHSGSRWSRPCASVRPGCGC